jgi:hypothetical protein
MLSLLAGGGGGGGAGWAGSAGFSLERPCPERIDLSQAGVFSSVNELPLPPEVARRIQSGIGPSTGDSISLPLASSSGFFFKSSIILTLAPAYGNIGLKPMVNPDAVFCSELVTTHHKILCNGLKKKSMVSPFI